VRWKLRQQRMWRLFPWYAIVTGVFGIVLNSVELAGYGNRPTWLALTQLVLGCLMLGVGVSLLLFLRSLPSGGGSPTSPPPRPSPRSAAELARVRRQVRWVAFAIVACGVGVIVAGVLLDKWLLSAAGGGVVLWGLFSLLAGILGERRNAKVTSEPQL
jgi:hypothetical protein